MSWNQILLDCCANSLFGSKSQIGVWFDLLPDRAMQYLEPAVLQAAFVIIHHVPEQVGPVKCYPLYSTLPPAQQQRIFEPVCVDAIFSTHLLICFSMMVLSLLGAGLHWCSKLLSNGPLHVLQCRQTILRTIDVWMLCFALLWGLSLLSTFVLLEELDIQSHRKACRHPSGSEVWVQQSRKSFAPQTMSPGARWQLDTIETFVRSFELLSYIAQMC